jgi:hypothetical protein
MSTHKTFFGKLLGWVGDIFHNAMQKLWDSLSASEQASFKHGSGVIAIINKHITEVPEVIVAEIETEFPDLDLSALEQSLLNVCTTLGITPPTIDIKGAIAAIQAWLGSKTGKIWEWASSAAAELVTVALMPNETFFEKVSLLIQWVYDTFIKKP